MASFSDYTKKKKKKQATENVSFTDYTKSVLGRDDIAEPTYKTYKVSDDDDIAPVKTEEKDERKWFEKGAFEDGYQFGDVTKTILGTVTDTAENLGTGIIGMGEKILDAGMTLGSLMNRSTMNQAAESEIIFNAVSGKKKSASNVLDRYDSYQDQVEKETADFVSKDLYDEGKVAKAIITDPMKKIGINAETDSVFGEKTDSLVQSAGQLGATAALQAVGVPWWLTTGATTFGSEAEGAFNQGADFDEAVLSSTISAGAEILSEKLSGGISFGGKTLDDLWLKPLTSRISSKALRTFTKLGIDATGEAFEELFSGVVSNLGTALYKEEDLKDILASEEALDEYVESMVGGFVLGGGMGSINAIKSNKNGVDYASELTNNEKAVVDKVYKDTVAEKEKDGKKLTQREKSKIYDDVLEQMEKGYISTDTIEEVLGGKTFEAYKSAVEKENALQGEFDTLNKMKQGEMTGEQLDRRAELKEELAKLKENPDKDFLKSKLAEDSFELVKGSRLAESYNEKSRRGQAFEADLSQYDEKYQGTIKKAVESGILNNSRRTHEMVDFVAKISADKGVLFDFTDNEKIKNTSYAVDGKIVNGFVDENGSVVLNIESAKSLNSTAGHEITHILEGTELYQPLSDIITEYAKTKGEYDSRLEALNKLYEGVYKGEDFNTKVQKELVADLVGDYIFTDKAFVQKLSTENRNVFQKIYDEIKYLCKVATAGSKEARELEKVKKTFAEVYRENGKTESKGDKKYSLSTEGMSEADIETAQTVIKSLKTNAMSSKYLDGYATYTADRMEREIAYSSASGNPDYAKSYITWIDPIDFIYATTTNDKFRAKLKEEAGALDIEKLQNEIQPIHLTVNFETGEIVGHEGRHRMLALQEQGIRKVAVVIDARNDNKYYTKPIDFMHLKGQKFAEYQQGTDMFLHNMLPLSERYAETAKELFTNKPKSGIQYSLSDSEGTQLSKEQQDFFKDSKMRDDNGNLKVMYHGSEYAGFHEFNNKFSDDDTSFFFVDRNDVAQTYSGSSEVYTARTFNTVEEFNKFFEEIDSEEFEVVKQGDKYALLENGDVEVTSDTLKGLYDEFCDYTGLGQGQANYKVYLNLTNPLVVDANGRNWNRISGEFSQEVYDRYKSLTDEEKQALIQLASWEDASIFRDEIQTAVESVERKANYVDEHIRNLASASEKLDDADMYRLFDIATDNFSEESLRENAVKYLNTRDYSQRAKEQGYDGVIFKNIVDNGGFADGKEGASTVAIAFESNQIKSVANDKPTGNADIRYSVSDKNITDVSTGYAYDETYYTMSYKQDGKTVGTLEYGEYEGKPNVKMIEVIPEYRRKGIGTKLLQELQRKYPDQEIDFGMSTPDGTKLIDAITYDVTDEKVVADRQKLKDLQSELNELQEKLDILYDTENLTEEQEAEMHRLGDRWEEVYNSINKLEPTLRGKKSIKTFVKTDTKYSLSEDSQGRELSKEQQNYFKNAKTTDEQGRLKPFYHGTGRADRVGTVFDPNRATSGPMAFFTDNKQIGENYARDKKDTSLEYDEMYDDYYTQFRTEINGKNMSVSEAWNYLPYSKKAEIREKAKHIKLDEDYENVIYDESEQYGNGGFDAYTINSHKGNILEALTDSWLESGTILGEEQMFLDVLKMVGLDDVQYMNPDYREEKVYEVYLNITNPFDTSDISEEMFNALKTAAENTEFEEGNSADMWDKRNISPERWIERLEDDIKNGTTHTWTSIPDFVTETLKAHGYDGIFDTGGKGGGESHTVAIPFYSEQIKNIDNKTPTTDKDIRYSLSEQDEAPTKHGNFNIYGKDVKLETEPTVEDIAPVMESTPVTEEEAIAHASEDFASLSDEDAPPEVEAPYTEYSDTTRLDDETLKNISKSLTDVLYLKRNEAKAIREIVQQYSTTEFPSKADLFWDIKEKFGEKYYEETLPDVVEVRNFLRKYRVSVSDTIKGDIADYNSLRKSLYNKVNVVKDGVPVDSAYQELSEMFPSFFPEDITNPTDQFLKIAEVADMSKTTTESYKLDDETIQAAVDIITDEVNTYKELSAKMDAEDLARESLEDIAPMRAKQIVDNANSQNDTLQQPIETVEYRQAKKLKALEKELAENKQLRSETIADYSNKISRLNDEYAALSDKSSRRAQEIMRSFLRYERLKSNVDADYSKRISDLETRVAEMKQNVKTDRVAEVLTEEPTVEKEKRSGWDNFVRNIVDKGAVFEKLALKNKNRKLQAKYNFLHYSEGIAQRLIGKGTKGVKALNDIRAAVEKTGKTEEFYTYLYHKHNVDRMNLEDRFDDVENKPVFGDYVTSEESDMLAHQYELENPEFVDLALDVYDYMNYLRDTLVEKGVISQDTADLWAEMYPHYVPIRRVGESGVNINVALDTNKTGVNAPIKRATGSSKDILPLFDTMAMRTMQTFKAAAKNSFGVELKNTLGKTIEKAPTNIDEIIDSVDSHESLLQEGKDGMPPTFTVFENGERVTFEITEEMYEALKPTSKGMAHTYKVPNAISNLQRNILTQYNPTFMLTNAFKDAQDVLLNSQHPARTYANFPRAIVEMLGGKGKYYNEYIENGGEQNTYFEKDSNTFAKEKSTLRKVVGFPLDAIAKANDFIERIPRLAEYIASRQKGASVEVAMLDSARVTTNFAAGGDVTKFLNRNGVTFLNASVQGAYQQVRNIREAKANGLKGWLGLATKTIIAGLPAILLNGLLWGDDEEYEELSDYVKDNYYVVAKTEDGKFIRIPKGRAVAVIQDGFEQIGNALTGNDEVDFQNFFELVMTNVAPNNPIDNNILSPIMQVADNKTWYGEDLVPTRLQDVPKAEQYDESTDALSKWLGENLNFSPMKINYLLNQYSGGVGDVVLPMLTPEAESGDNSLGGNLIAPLKDKFTTDNVMNNQNVSDFYDKVDELTVNANSSRATDEDILKSKYINSVSSDLGELYQQKREIQNSSLADDVKYERVRDIQEQINSLARNSLNSYDSVNIQGKYATVGNQHFRWYEPSEDSTAEAGWQRVSGKQLEKQEEVTDGLGISASEYWSNKEEYDYAYEYPEKYAVAKVVGGYEAYKTYSSELYDIKADKDSSGKSISGSRKEKVADYLNSLDIDYYEKIILFKSEYNADDTHNYEIIDYLNGRDDISYEEMESILKKLGFTVSSDGTISW